MKLKDLIGYQLVYIDETKIIVKKGDKDYILKIEEDYGDCCGFNEIDSNLFISKEEIEKNPVITNIEIIDDDNSDKYRDGHSVKITFYGNNKKLAELDSYSSSGSGWGYGACVNIMCKELNIDEEITHW